MARWTEGNWNEPGGQLVTLGLFLRFWNSQPFEPFYIRSAEGREQLVRHPEEVTVSEAGETVFLIHPTGQFECIDMALIVSLKTAAAVDPDDYDIERHNNPEDSGSEG